MPIIQELMGVPSFGAELGKTLGSSISGGLAQQLDKYHKRKTFEKAGLPSAYADLDPAIAGPLIKQQQKNALIQQIFKRPGQSETPSGEMGSFGEPSTQTGSSGALPSETPLTSNLTRDQIKELALYDTNLARVFQAEEKIRIAEEAPYKKSEIQRSNKYLDQINDKRESTQRARSSLMAAEEALKDRNLGFFSRDNLANLTGIQGLASPEGAVFNAAAKNFFLADLQSAVGRPNQFLEKILKNAVFDVGKSNEANAALLEFYKNQVELEEEKIRITDNLEDYYREKGLPPPGNIGRLVDQQLRPFAQKKEKELESKFENSTLLKKSPNESKTIRMTDPSGILRNVPRDQVKEAEKEGYKLAK